MIILGIETSCDETAVSVARGEGESVEILSNVVSSQIEIHKKYGGVIPEVAAREHVLNILPVLQEALGKAGVETPSAFGHSPLKSGRRINVDAIAVTTGPGLITSLLSGLETAKTLSFAWSIPIIGVNHIEGHIYANFIKTDMLLRGAERRGNLINHEIASLSKKDEIARNDNSKNFPAIILTVSGGHTMLVLMKGHGRFQMIGDTRDDAAGEAFDKAAKLLGLGYPGGPAIASAAARFKHTSSRSVGQAKGDFKEIKLPRPMIDSGDATFSFSGLKTALLYQIQKDPNWKERVDEYAYEFQKAVVETLVSKTIKAAKKYKVKTVMMAGGVSANTELRGQLENAVKTKLDDVGFSLPDLKYTTDNAAMIAAAGYFKARDGKYGDWRKIKVDPNLVLK